MTPTEQATAEQLRTLVAAAAPAVTTRGDLAGSVVAATRGARRSWRRRTLIATGAVVVAAAVAAATFTDRGDHRSWTQPSGAMVPTVAVGQTVVLDKHAQPERGDVVLLDVNHGGATWEALGRVVGLPGDTVSCPTEPDGTCEGVVVSGRVLDEPWLTTPTAPFAPFAVPSGHLFFLGDARDQANDSRYVGAQPLASVLGVVVARVADDGSREPLPGTPRHRIPGGGAPVDPADPVPPADAVPADSQP